MSLLPLAKPCDVSHQRWLIHAKKKKVSAFENSAEKNMKWSELLYNAYDPHEKELRLSQVNLNTVQVFVPRLLDVVSTLIKMYM